MKRVNSVTYDVIPAEKLSIKVTPTNFGGSGSSVESVLDGNPLPNVGTKSAPAYRFTATKPVTTPASRHVVLMEFTFFDDTPADAFYQVAISGQQDVGCPCGFTIAKDDQDLSPDVRFRVKSDD
jgi:hypothetical protein